MIVRPAVAALWELGIPSLTIVGSLIELAAVS